MDRDFKVFHTYNNILVHRAENLVNWCFLQPCELRDLMARCKAKHPDCDVWHKIVGTPIKTGYGLNYYATVQIIYRPNKIAKYNYEPNVVVVVQYNYKNKKHEVVQTTSAYYSTKSDHETYYTRADVVLVQGNEQTLFTGSESECSNFVKCWNIMDNKEKFICTNKCKNMDSFLFKLYFDKQIKSGKFEM